MSARPSPSRSPRDQRGVVFPSPVVILSVVAVGMAALAFVFTQGSSADEDQKAITSSSPQQTMAASPTASPTGKALTKASQKPKPQKPKVDRGATPVVVFNNSGISGLAASVASKTEAVGWQVVGADNWYGTIPTTTVYYPPALKAAAKQLSLDLGITRTAPAVSPMRDDRLTVILTAPLA